MVAILIVLRVMVPVKAVVSVMEQASIVAVVVVQVLTNTAMGLEGAHIATTASALVARGAAIIDVPAVSVIKIAHNVEAMDHIWVLPVRDVKVLENVLIAMEKVILDSAAIVTETVYAIPVTAR